MNTARQVAGLDAELLRQNELADLFNGETLIANYWGLGDESIEEIIKHAKSNYINRNNLKLKSLKDQNLYPI